MYSGRGTDRTLAIIVPHRRLVGAGVRIHKPKFTDDRTRMDCYIIVMSSVDQLFEEAAQLPEDQKLTLAYRLLASGEPPITDEIEQEWDMVIRDRIQRYDQGKALSRSAGKVFSDLDQKLSK